MRKFLPFVVVLAAVWAWQRMHGSGTEPLVADVQPTQLLSSENGSAVTSLFSCDGRQYCSQMTSCAEATYFLRHCPSTKMDGNHDGVPCEQQWCVSK
jgi:Excalibur calcium-binding domain